MKLKALTMYYDTVLGRTVQADEIIDVENEDRVALLIRRELCEKVPQRKRKAKVTEE